MDVKRSEHNGLHSLEIYECKIEVLDALARAAAVDVTVENVTPVQAVNQWSQWAVSTGGPAS